MDERLKTILADYGKGDEAALVPILQRVQGELGYVSEDAVFAISDTINVPPAEVFGVLTFYAQFRLTPMGKHNCRVCRGTACHVRGAPTILTGVRDELGLGEDTDTTSDHLFTLEQIACFGACSLAPVIRVGETVYGNMDQRKAVKLLERYERREPVR